MRISDWSSDVCSSDLKSSSGLVLLGDGCRDYIGSRADFRHHGRSRSLSGMFLLDDRRNCEFQGFPDVVVAHRGERMGGLLGHLLRDCRLLRLPGGLPISHYGVWLCKLISYVLVSSTKQWLGACPKLPIDRERVV